MVGSVTLEAVHKLVEHKTGERIKKVTNTGGQSNLIAFVDASIGFSKIYFDDNFELVAIGTDGKDRRSFIHCILLDGDLKDGKLPLSGARHGVLVIDDECMTDTDIEMLANFNK